MGLVDDLLLELPDLSPEEVEAFKKIEEEFKLEGLLSAEMINLVKLLMVLLRPTSPSLAKILTKIITPLFSIVPFVAMAELLPKIFDPLLGSVTDLFERTSGRWATPLAATMGRVLGVNIDPSQLVGPQGEINPDAFSRAWVDQVLTPSFRS